MRRGAAGLVLTLALASGPAAAEGARDIVVLGRGGECLPRADANGRPVPDAACLNRQLATRIAAHRPPVPLPGAGGPGHAPPSEVGTFSFTATQQRMGGNFGRSAHPLRPGAPVHGRSPIVGRKP